MGKNISEQLEAFMAEMDISKEDMREALLEAGLETIEVKMLARMLVRQANSMGEDAGLKGQQVTAALTVAAAEDAVTLIMTGVHLRSDNIPQTAAALKQQVLAQVNEGRDMALGHFTVALDTAVEGIVESMVNCEECLDKILDGLQQMRSDRELAFVSWDDNEVVH